MESTKTSTKAKRSYYNCAKCPAYCCAIYDLVQVNESDVKRLAENFRVGFRTAMRRFTKTYRGERILRQKADPIFGKACSSWIRRRAAVRSTKHGQRYVAFSPSAHAARFMTC